MVCSVRSLSHVWLFYDSMDYSTPGLPVHHQLPEFTQTHVHWVGDAIQPSHPLWFPPSPAFSFSQWYIAAAAAKSLQSCPTLCDPTDGSLPGSPVLGILQARTLEWVAISFSNAWKWKVKVKSLSRIRLLATPWTAAYQAPPSMGFSRQEYWSGVPLPSLTLVFWKICLLIELSSFWFHLFLCLQLTSSTSHCKPKNSFMICLLNKTNILKFFVHICWLIRLINSSILQSLMVWYDSQIYLKS